MGALAHVLHQQALRCPARCFLCAAAADPEKDDENYVVWRGKLVFCIINLYPYNNGHLLVSPYRHKGDPGELRRRGARRISGRHRPHRGPAQKVMNPQGFNIGINLGKAAGAGVAEHLHVHIVPRWDGDTNFMPVLADTKIIPQALADLYDKLESAIDRVRGGSRDKPDPRLANALTTEQCSRPTPARSGRQPRQATPD